jgi:hypothetical protein
MNDMQHGNTEARGFRQASPQDWPGVCELLEAAGLRTGIGGKTGKQRGSSLLSAVI